MSITKEKIKNIIKKHGKNSQDSGDVKVQIGIFTERIQVLTEHLKTNKKDKSTQRGLLNLVSKRRRLLKFLKKKDYTAYNSLIEALKIRK